MSDAAQFRKTATPAIQRALGLGSADDVGHEQEGLAGGRDARAPATTNKTPSMVLLSRDALQHITLRMVWSTLANFRELGRVLGRDIAKRSFLLLGHYLLAPASMNFDVKIGGMHYINLRQPPFQKVRGNSLLQHHSTARIAVPE